MLGKIEGKQRSGQQRVRWLNGVIDSLDISLSKLWEIVTDREVWHTAAGHKLATEQQELSIFNNVLIQKEVLK